ncbi:O-antigen ligase family protein [Pseudomonas gingeri]|uniref:O-antigen ligase family protein n=1 Tax=Pseudomonas gingeri TaxID=117681 RepID=UPI0015A067FC|nr:O-antigen ligase family protein [Pseudomonas gingeri]NWD09327.1 O-antigen ligase family protein [Pseudomonas gingeri]NWE32104.1 O-antigen ligase family protein [Pseudomonas gingeri]NWE58678.1 O-antigen ligase family protein [Pseudomonas gingeri]NWF01221.1 O-antigen ligase family protein [Pseudomonas gingeri]
MSVVRRARVKIWLIFTLLITASTVSGYGLGGHTDQRLGQFFIGIAAVGFLFIYRTQFRSVLIDRLTLLWGGAVLLVGCVSSLFAHLPVWAFSEIALLVMCCNCVLAFARTRQFSSLPLDRLLIFFVVFICALKGIDFLLLMFRSFSNGSGVVDTDLLLRGFSNKRFYGQFQTFTLPLLAVPLLLLTTGRFAQVLVFLLLSLWWLIAITGGTRGTWLAMGTASVVLLFSGPYGRRWLVWQLSAAAVALLLFWLLFTVLAEYIGIEVQNFAGGRLTTALSARDVLWQQAWDMIRERPLLGFGPMHFADIHNPIAAHPHQAILQWASEWGVPSTLLVMWLVGRGLWATFRLIRERAYSSDPVDLLRVCLFASLIGALTQSMVDGVIVMPYSQLWLSLVVGWLMGIHVWKGEPSKPNALVHWSWMGVSTAAVLFLVYIVIRDVPHLDERDRLYQEQYGGHLQPRFWTQGVIAIKPQ